jgi:Arginase family
MRRRSITRSRDAKWAWRLVKQYSAAARITDPLMTSFAFLSQSTFLRAPAASAATPFAVAGIAWDGAVTNRPGARFGPRVIREASHLARSLRRAERPRHLGL